jgi:hypothetical protein
MPVVAGHRSRRPDHLGSGHLQPRRPVTGSNVPMPRQRARRCQVAAPMAKDVGADLGEAAAGDLLKAAVAEAVASNSFRMLATSSANNRPHVAGVLHALVGRDLYINTDTSSRKAKHRRESAGGRMHPGAGRYPGVAVHSPPARHRDAAAERRRRVALRSGPVWCSCAAGALRR